MNSKTDQAIELIRQAGARGMRSTDLNVALDIDCSSALLQYRVNDKTLTCSKVIAPHVTRSVNVYHIRGTDDALAAGAELGRKNGSATPAAQPALRTAPIELQRAAPVSGPAPIAKATPAEPAAPLIGPIETDMPLPKRMRGSAVRDAIVELKPGQSRVLGYTKQGIQYAAKSAKVRVRISKVGDAGDHRVWRLEPKVKP